MHFFVIIFALMILSLYGCSMPLESKHLGPSQYVSSQANENAAYMKIDCKDSFMSSECGLRQVTPGRAEQRAQPFSMVALRDSQKYLLRLIEESAQDAVANSKKLESFICLVAIWLT